MSEFDKLKDDAEQYGKDHPEQVEKGEQAAEKKLGLPGQGDDQAGPGNQPGQGQGQGQDAQGQAQQNQNGGDQAGQGSSGQGQ
jgi:hypothetical protein